MELSTIWHGTIKKKWQGTIYNMTWYYRKYDLELSKMRKRCWNYGTTKTIDCYHCTFLYTCDSRGPCFTSPLFGARHFRKSTKIFLALWESWNSHLVQLYASTIFSHSLACAPHLRQATRQPHLVHCIQQSMHSLLTLSVYCI